MKALILVVALVSVLGVSACGLTGGGESSEEQRYTQADVDAAREAGREEGREDAGGDSGDSQVRDLADGTEASVQPAVLDRSARTFRGGISDASQRCDVTIYLGNTGGLTDEEYAEALRLAEARACAPGAQMPMLGDENVVRLESGTGVHFRAELN